MIGEKRTHAAAATPRQATALPYRQAPPLDPLSLNPAPPKHQPSNLPTRPQPRYSEQTPRHIDPVSRRLSSTAFAPHMNYMDSHVRALAGAYTYIHLSTRNLFLSSSVCLYFLSLSPFLGTLFVCAFETERPALQWVAVGAYFPYSRYEE